MSGALPRAAGAQHEGLGQPWADSGMRASGTMASARQQLPSGLGSLEHRVGLFAQEDQEAPRREKEWRWRCSLSG